VSSSNPPLLSFTLEHNKHFVLCMNLTIPCKNYARHKTTSLMKISMGCKTTTQGTKPQGNRTTSLMKNRSVQNYARHKTTNPMKFDDGVSIYIVVEHLVLPSDIGTGTQNQQPKPQLGVECKPFFFLLQVLFSECSCKQSTKI
jgi:hypothetical protein